MPDEKSAQHSVAATVLEIPAAAIRVGDDLFGAGVVAWVTTSEREPELGVHVKAGGVCLPFDCWEMVTVRRG